MENARKFFKEFGMRFFLGTLIVFASQILTSMIATAICNAMGIDLSDNMVAQLLVALVPMYLVGMPLLALLVSKIPVEAPTIEDKRMHAGHIIKAFVVTYGLVMASNLVGTYLGVFIESLVHGAQASTNQIQTIAIEGNMAFNAVYMILFAPVYEEFIFRKLIVDRVSRYGQGVAVVVSGLMFGLFHANLTQFVYAFVMGAFMAYIYSKTGKIHYTIILHMIVNLFGSVFSVLAIRQIDLNEYLEIASSGDMAALMQYATENAAGFAVYGMYMMFVGIIAIVGIILFIVALAKKQFYFLPGETQIPAGQRFKTVMGNPGMILFLVLFVLMILGTMFMPVLTGGAMG